jgi:CheY-like chemotaxis protein
MGDNDGGGRIFMKQGISLLYAEDEPQARALLEKLLHSKFPDLTVYVAADGEEGMALFHEYRPQVILTDMAMPGMDGAEMIRRIRAINSDAYVIAITAYNDPQFCAKTTELHLNHCITKPVDFKALLHVIAEAIEAVQ